MIDFSWFHPTCLAKLQPRSLHLCKGYGVSSQHLADHSLSCSREWLSHNICRADPSGSLNCCCFHNSPLGLQEPGMFSWEVGGPSTWVLRLTGLISEQLWQFAFVMMPSLLPCPWSPHVNLIFFREGVEISRLIAWVSLCKSN